MADRLYRLRLYAVVRRNDQYRDVSDIRASGTHRCKRFVARRIEEYDTLSVVCDLRCADMLCDSAGFTGSDAGMSDFIQ